jgi:hypothetical protein
MERTAGSICRRMHVMNRAVNRWIEEGGGISACSNRRVQREVEDGPDPWDPLVSKGGRKKSVPVWER